MSAITATTETARPAPHRSKLMAGFLAFLFGGLGLHRLYLGTKLWWLYPAWLIAGMVLYVMVGSRETTWIAVAAMLPVWAGFAEAAAFCVMPDDRWDARFNVRSNRHSETGWACVMLAITVLLIGTSIMLTGIILASQFYYEAQDISIDR